MSDSVERHFRFGPLERTGLIASFSGRQVIVLIIAAVFGVFALIVLGPVIGMLVAICIAAGALFACTKLIAGRPAVEWSDTAARHLVARSQGRTVYESEGPALGHSHRIGEDSQPETPLALPKEIDGLEVLGYPYRGAEAGIMFDSKTLCYTATLKVKPGAFVLLSDEEQQSKLRDWEDILSMFGQANSPIAAIQWLERTLPARPDDLVEYLNEKRDTSQPETSPAVKSYLTLLKEAEHVQQQHELYLTLKLDAKRKAARQWAKKIADGHEGYCEVLMREVTALSAALRRASIDIEGVVRPRMLARIIRLSFDPFTTTAPELSNLQPGDPFEGVDPGNMGPMNSNRRWDVFEADGSKHVTYWIEEWPKVPVGPAFLMPLLLASGLTRSIAVTIKPVDTANAIREVEHAATMHEAEADERVRRNFRLTAGFRREGDGIRQREEELASGFSDARFSGFITVSGRTHEELDASCAQLEHAALQSRLRVVKMNGAHHQALTYTMPLGRGLRS